jgi:hypothetical protein
MKRMTIAHWICACGISLLLGGCGGMLLPEQSEIHTSQFETYQAVRDAFDKIKPMRTSLDEMSALGFDVQNSSNAQILSYLDVADRFMPNGSLAFDRLDPAVQACIMARTACQGYSFEIKHQSIDRSGSLFLDIFGFEHTSTETGWSAQVLILVQDGHITHKLLSGEPNVQVVRTDIEPLGPAQNLSGIVGGSGSVGVTTTK